MSKKWITILVAAVVVSLLPASAFASCRVTLLGAGVNGTGAGNVTFGFHDSSAGAFVFDPVPLTPGDKVDGIVQSSTGDATGAISAGAAIPAVAPGINAEGVAERVGDLLVNEDASGGPLCFNTGSTITITFNGLLTSPSTPGTLSVPGNLDIYDSNGIAGLTISQANVTQGFAANTTQSIITIVVGQAGTPGNLQAATSGATGAAVRVKNIRLNATSLQGTLPNIGVTVAVSGAGSAAFPLTLVDAGAVAHTTAGGTTASGTVAISNGTWTDTNNVVDNGLIAVTNVLVTVNPTTNVGTYLTPANNGMVTGLGTQSAGAGLFAYGQAAFRENFANAFRVSGGTCASTNVNADTCASQVANDAATVATSLVFNLTGIPSGVTVTFPSSMTTSAAFGSTNNLSFSSRTGSTLTNSGAAGALTVVYDTSRSKPGAQGKSFIVETADNADSGQSNALNATNTAVSNPNCQLLTIGGVPGAFPNNLSGFGCDKNPKVGVKIGAVSGSGTVNLNLAIGRGDVATPLFAGDDVAADTTVFPRYATTARMLATAQPFFVINPTRTTLLFPFVSTIGGFNTGLSVVNTCADTGVFGNTKPTCNQLGGIVFFFFGVNPDTGAAVQASLNSDLTNGGTNLSTVCRGFDSNGRVAPGTGAACSIQGLLPLITGKPSKFDGYVIAVTGFNNAHGFSAQFEGHGNPFAANEALILGLNGALARVGTEALGF